MGRPTQASSSICVASTLFTVYVWKSRPQLFRTPAWAARWNTCVTPSSSGGQVRLLQSRLDEAEARLAERRPARFASLIGPRVVVGEAVDAHDLVAAVEQAAGEGGPDEAGNAGDERSHDNSDPRALGKAARATRAGHRRVHRAAPGQHGRSAWRTTS